ncbi:MAG: bifunctional DNA primase/polymerase [Verrucomicrobia bacterium]|nr:bifunctional DNA primase/polymerase [Verrucomicrobiota bacterium]
MASIPHQLRKEDCRFVLIKRAEKKPFEKGWSKENNYRFDDPKLRTWIENGGNYGVCCGYGDLAGIDSDNPEIAEVFERNFGQTFRIRSGSGRGFHDYVTIRGLDGKVIFEKEGIHLGEAQFLGQQLVGPGSIHPSGGIYRIEHDVPILEINKHDFEKAFEGYFKKRKALDRLAIRESHDYGESDLNKIPLTAILEIKGRWIGNEIHGVNPWHGAKTGTNFSINTEKNLWFCFRCGVGGNVAKAIALNEGIISECSAELGREDFLKVLNLARRKYGLID